MQLEFGAIHVHTLKDRDNEEYGYGFCLMCHEVKGINLIIISSKLKAPRERSFLYIHSVQKSLAHMFHEHF